MTDWRTNLPPGTVPGDESERELRRAKDDDRDLWEALWDLAYRYEEENRRE